MEGPEQRSNSRYADCPSGGQTWSAWYVEIWFRDIVHKTDHIQLDFLEKLEMRVPCRQTMHHVEHEDDGTMPSGPARNSVLAETYMELMRKLFDYG